MLGKLSIRNLIKVPCNPSDEPHPTGLRCVATPEKGRGMASTGDLPQASLVHTEDPFSMV